MSNNLKGFFNSGSNNRSVGKKITNKLKNVKNRSIKLAKNSSNNIKKMSIWQIIWIVFIIIIIIIIIIYWGINVSSNKKSSSSSHLILVGKEANAFDIPNNTAINVKLPENGGGLTFSTWIFIQDWNYKFAERKNILNLKLGSQQDDIIVPGMWLYAKTNALAIRTSTVIDANEGCDIQNIPLQKWVNIIYILQNRTVDIYINGKLERSCVLKGLPKWSSTSKNATAHICSDGGFYGRIASTEYFNHAISMNKVDKIYNSGPNSIKKKNNKIWNNSNDTVSLSENDE